MDDHAAGPQAPLSPEENLRGLLQDDFAPLERERLAGELTELIADMLREGRGRSDPIREIFGRVGDKWSVLLLLLLRVGGFRHATLRRLVGATSAEGRISQRMLTLRLRGLERNGLIGRSITDDVPPRVDYFITPLGRGLIEQVERLMDWIKANNAEIRRSQAAFEARGRLAGPNTALGQGPGMRARDDC